MGGLTRVTIDFERSHLVFPTVIGTILLLLGAAILVTRRRQIMAAGQYWSGIFSGLDKLRFLGTLVLTVIYFMLMVPVGDIWPNTGMGFLLCSIPYVFLTGYLFLHDRSVRDVLPVVITAAVVPTVVWSTFTYLFFMTLP